MIWSLPGQLPPSPWTKGQGYLPVDQWDSDMLLNTHLKHAPEPSTTGNERSVLEAQAAFYKLRIRDLERTQVSIIPHVSYELESQLASARFRRKLLLWLSFPINEFPEEILVHIFRMAFYSVPDVRQITLVRLHLTWVCRLWRDVAINDKLLWNTIWFRDRPPFTRSLAWVDRAGSAPLELRIGEAQRREGETVNPPRLTEQQMEALLDNLLLKLSTIRILVVVVDTWAPALTLLRRISQAGVPSSLERFELHRAGSWYGWAETRETEPETLQQHVLFNGSAPKLTSLTINGVGIDWVRSPLTNLTVLDLRRMVMTVCPTLQQWRDVLQASPNLFKLAIAAFGPRWYDGYHDQAPPPSLPPISLPFLRELTLGDCSVGYGLYILSQISSRDVMSLCFFNLSCGDFGGMLPAITGRFKRLKILALYDFKVEDGPENLARVVLWLDSMPQLKILKISAPSKVVLSAFLEDPRLHVSPPVATNDDDVVAETSEPPRKILCPDLRHLHFEISCLKDIITLCRCRRLLGGPIYKVHIMGDPQVIHKDSVKLRYLNSVVQGGMYINTGALYTPEEKEVHREMIEGTSVSMDTVYHDSR